MAQFSDNTVALRVCPRCLKAFYAHAGQDIACPKCGYVFFERRYGDRVGLEFDFVITLQGRTIAARLKDYSDGGIKMVYKGAAIGKDTVVDLDIEEIGLHQRAKAVWSGSLHGSTSTGLAFLKRGAGKRQKGKR